MAPQIADVNVIGFEGLEPVDEILPNTFTRRYSEFLVLDGELDPGFETFVKNADAVACEN